MSARSARAQSTGPAVPTSESAADFLDTAPAQFEQHEFAADELDRDDTALTGASRRVMPITLPRAFKHRTTRQMISHHWECTVEEVHETEFTAVLRSLRDIRDSEKSAEIPREEVSMDDLELLTPGAVFYWTIGYETSPAGTRRRFSLIKFRRLPAWTEKDLKRVTRTGDELFERFGKDSDALATERG